MDSLTDEEKKMIDELKRRTINDVTPKMLEDVSLFYRFAKARDFNLGQAETMLRKHISWRRDLKVDTILTDYEPPEVLARYVPLSCPCFDKEGCAVLVHDLGRADPKGLANSATNADMLKYVVYFIEKVTERIIQKGENGKKRYLLGKSILSPIYDFDEVTYAKAANVKTWQLLISIVQGFLDNYPEYLRTITVINAPSYFAWMYNTLKPILPSTVIQKVQIYASDGWKEVLLENIEADHLPEYLGGNRKDPDGNPLCKTFIIRGQDIPKRYYRQNRIKHLALESGVEKITLMPFSKEEITLKVREGNSFIEWEFETKSRDIDFSLLFRGKSPEEPVELIPKHRVDTSDGPERGCFKCDKVGNYTLIFDNSHSWIRSKEVYYRAGIKRSEINGFLESTCQQF